MTNAIKTKQAKIVKNVRLYRMSMPEHECPWGLKAADWLNQKGIEFKDYKLTSRAEVDAFKENHNVSATPQIFFDEERIGGYSDLADYFGVEAEKEDYSYTPVVAIFSTAGLVAWSAALGVPGFMGVSLSMLASLKLMDIDAFAESFEKYDLITQQTKPYSKAFPFLELLLGLGFLSGVAPILTGVGSLVLGTSGAISVFKAVYVDKLELNCACVGGNSKAPLGAISFLENAIMIGMGAFLLFSTSAENMAQLRTKEAVLAPQQREMIMPDHEVLAFG
ncbi:MAG: MauE/DoxX family redox-associated membrane protein [Cyanobacteria bacterium P01_D01_bin.1]